MKGNCDFCFSESWVTLSECNTSQLPLLSYRFHVSWQIHTIPLSICTILLSINLLVDIQMVPFPCYCECGYSDISCGWIQSPLVTWPGTVQLIHKAEFCELFEELPHWSHKGCTNWHSHAPWRRKGFSSPHLSHLLLSIFLMIAILTWGDMKWQNCFNSHIPDGWGCWNKTLLACCISSLESCLFVSFAHFLIWQIWFPHA